MSKGYETAQPWLAGDALRAGIVRPRSRTLAADAARRA